ncbi:alpha/beta hydrolase [Cobetia sp. 4B]|uniref:alpha/beta hydrolase n=1 Tax=Cobetia sp. 4B TaxID=2758724 RepID=UPI001C058E6A|nr:alpha/beta hydrolase-fold protein [Cobetia sp. 4B]MBR9754434.1 alpha/beta hydrolase [Gammaproteobacteria bacterium]QWN35609.1 alpha/beta hydrolase [Cobetia sp. 4B]
MLTSVAVSVPALAMSHATDEALPGTTTSFTQHSHLTGHDYLIQVALPQVAPPPGGYPVLLVLDGNRHLDLFTAARDILGRRGFDKAPADLAIVAVGYAGTDEQAEARRATVTTLRYKDFTPPLTSGTAPEGTGGGAQFLAYLTQSLPPELASRYPLDLKRPALVGHSLGGLFALHAQQQQPEAFGAIFAISPSLWWLQENDQANWPLRLACSEAVGPVLIAAGGREQSPQPQRNDPKRDRLRVQRAMIDNAQAYARQLGERCPQIEVQWRRYAGEDHGSVMWPAARSVMEMLLGSR